jgi:hypothetical protein
MLTGKPISIKVTPPIEFDLQEWNMKYLVNAEEDLLLVVQYHGILLKFRIFKINWNRMSWERVEHLGKRSFFIESKPCVSFYNSDNLLKNTIYFSHEILNKVVLINLSDDSVTKLRRPARVKGSNKIWFTPIM